MDTTKLDSLKLKNVEIQDQFWGSYTSLVPKVIIPYQWKILNNTTEDAKDNSSQNNFKITANLDSTIEDAEASNCLQNFKIAAGLEKGVYKGNMFLDTDVYKWLEALAYSIEATPDSYLEKLADEAIGLIELAQSSDGYLNNYITLTDGSKRWTNLLEAHELYSAGHLIEAAVAYFNATGKDKLLNVARRAADLICETFGTSEGKIKGYAGHQEIELALVKLYRATGERKYLDTAMYFIEERGSEPNYFTEEVKRRGGKYLIPEFNDYDLKYSQAHIPPRLQRTAEGHAVRAVYMYCAMADLAYEYNDAGLMEACEALWKNIVEKRMYITGSVGSSGFLERFTTDYDLPNDSNYSETCASIGLALFGLRMTAIKRDARYMDIVEKILYNAVLAGISKEGDRYFYVNPLEVWPPNCMPNTSKAHVKPVRQKWFSVACCPTNVARTLASLGQYIYLKDDSNLYLNLFIDNKAEIELQGHNLVFELKSTFLQDGKSTFTFETDEPCEFALRIRVPDYAGAAAFTVNGKKVVPPVQDGYAVFPGQWNGRCVIEIAFDIKARFIAAHPEVRADIGKIALVKGPLVYCLEEADNGRNLASIFVSPDTVLDEYSDDLLGGLPVLNYKGLKLKNDGWDGKLYDTAGFAFEPVDLKAVPYCIWGNRNPGEMTVWQKAMINKNI